MEKILVAVFDTESAAFEGLRAIENLHWGGDITLYGTAVIAKDSAGKTSIKREPESGALATGVGTFAGALVGALAGPAGAYAGAVGGASTGALIDLARYGFSMDFIDEVSTYLIPGKAALLADIDETWRVPVDTQLGILGGVVFRRPTHEVEDEQLAREAAEIDAEMRELDEEMSQADAETRAALEAQMDRARQHAESLRMTVDEKLERGKREMDAKVHALQEQMRSAREEQQSRIQSRMDEVKADYERRRQKLEEARPMIKEALRP